QPRTHSLDHATETRSSAQEQLHVFQQERADAAGSAVHARDPITVARPQSLSVAAQKRCGSRSSMRRLRHREDNRSPFAGVKSRAQFDVLVIGEEALVEDALAQRRAPIE